MIVDPYFTQMLGPRITVEEVERFIAERSGSLRCNECKTGNTEVEHALDSKEYAFMGGLVSPNQMEIELLFLTACPHCGTVRNIAAANVAKWRGTYAGTD
jgi:Zn finger protein HypA/HybF involved in hydrogenase expression